VEDFNIDPDGTDIILYGDELKGVEGTEVAIWYGKLLDGVPGACCAFKSRRKPSLTSRRTPFLPAVATLTEDVGTSLMGIDLASS
jgi:hypothetical protein